MKLTAPQQEALSKLTNEWQCSYELKTHRNILEALVNKGLIERRMDLGANFSPRTAIEYRRK